MRAGRLDRVLEIQQSTSVQNEWGNPVTSWTRFADARAELIQTSTEEFIRAYGVQDEAIAIFRMRYVDGVSTAQRVLSNGKYYNIKEIKEIGRRKALELRCVNWVGKI